ERIPNVDLSTIEQWVSVCGGCALLMDYEHVGVSRIAEVATIVRARGKICGHATGRRRARRIPWAKSRDVSRVGLGRGDRWVSPVGAIAVGRAAAGRSLAPARASRDAAGVSAATLGALRLLGT